MMRAKAATRSATGSVNRAVNRAQSMRDNALSVAMKRKEEFLGARVPKELRDKVTARASEQGIPVSILIRNILEEAFKSPPGSASSTRGGESPQGMVAPVHPATCMDALVLREAGRKNAPAFSTLPPSMAVGCREQPRFPAVLGWEMIRLNRQVDCSSCGKQLLPGASVTLGLAPELVQTGATHIILCDQCQGLM